MNLLQACDDLATNWIETGTATNRSDGHMIERLVLAYRAATMALAAAEYVGAVNARELANNVACGLSDGENDPYQTAYEAIAHRCFNFSFTCSDIAGCARAMARAWEGDDKS